MSIFMYNNTYTTTNPTAGKVAGKGLVDTKTVWLTVEIFRDLRYFFKMIYLSRIIRTGDWLSNKYLNPFMRYCFTFNKMPNLGLEYMKGYNWSLVMI